MQVLSQRTDQIESEIMDSETYRMRSNNMRKKHDVN